MLLPDPSNSNRIIIDLFVELKVRRKVTKSLKFFTWLKTFITVAFLVCLQSDKTSGNNLGKIQVIGRLLLMSRASALRSFVESPQASVKVRWLGLEDMEEFTRENCLMAARWQWNLPLLAACKDRSSFETKLIYSVDSIIAILFDWRAIAMTKNIRSQSVSTFLWQSYQNQKCVLWNKFMSV